MLQDTKTQSLRALRSIRYAFAAFGKDGWKKPNIPNMGSENEPIAFEAIPLEVREKIRGKEIKEIIYIESILTDGNPKYKTFDECRVCGGGTLTYSRGPRYDFFNGTLLWVADIWGYRCDNQDCNSVVLLLPEVTDELRQKIQNTCPRQLSSIQT